MGSVSPRKPETSHRRQMNGEMSTALVLTRPQPVVRQVSTCLLDASIGGKGKRLGQFNNCNAITTLSNGDVVVVDTHNNRIQLFDARLAPLREVGKGKLSSPWGAAAFPFGKFCVSEGPKRRVVIYTDSGDFISKFKITGIEEPCCVSTSPVTGNIIVTDYRSPTICIYDLEGYLVQKFQTHPENEYSNERPIAEHIACDKIGRIFLSFGHGVSDVQVFDGNGKFQFKFGNFTSACGIHITAKDNVIIAEREERTLSLYSTSGQFVQQLVSISNGMQMYPHDVTVVNGACLAVTAGDDVFACPTWLHLYKLG